MPSGDLRRITAEQIASTVRMDEAIAAVGDALVAAAAGHFEQPPRLTVDDGRLLVMAASDRRSRDAVVKTVSVRLGEDPESGTDAISGTVLWIDGVSGRPVLTADGAAVTALRTGAVTGLATDLLAIPGATRLALLGSGRQARTQLAAVCAVRPIEHVVVNSRTSAHAQSFAVWARTEYPDIAFDVAQTPDEAVYDADVVCCATGSRAPLFAAASTVEWTHVNAIGSYRTDMVELPTDLLTAATVVAVDDRAGCMAESGEILAALAAGLTPADLVPLGDLVRHPTQRRGRTVFKSVGCAVLDWGIGALLAQNSSQRRSSS